MGVLERLLRQQHPLTPVLEASAPKDFQTPEHCDFPLLWPPGQDLQISHAHTHTHTHTHALIQAHTEVHREPPLGLMIGGGKKANIHGELYFCPSHLTLLPLEEEFLNTPVGFPGGSVVKNSPTNAGDTEVVGSVPGWGRSPGEGNGNPLQYSCLGNAMDRGAWRATVHGVTKIRAHLSD